ncbi:purine permease ygfU [Escherichia coli]|uniref:Purine permease ygfU n=1 Tax=Escherichia coli TaxID=562 RepID=A0A376TUI4_ECOLX|nr:purine permease ygfU [Escherichia coli]
MLRDRHIIAMYRYRPLYGDPPAGDYVGDLCCCNTNDSHWDEPGYRPAGDIWLPLSPRVYHHIISATYWSLDAFIPATGYRCGYYFYWLSIIQVGIDWAAGGKGNPQYGNPVYLGISFAVLIFILLITRYAKGFMSNVAVLLGIVFGFLLSWMMNEVNLSGLHDASWFAIVTPMSFGMPIFDPVSILTMTAVLIIVFIESMGMFLALGEIVGRKLSSHDIIRGLRVDGVGTMIGGTFNSFPHTSFSQNVGLVSVTRVHSRWVCISSGIILILFGMVPKMAVLVASIPQFVLGGAGLVMFGMVLATGIRILSRCNYTTNRYNLYIVAISLGVGMTPTLSHDFFSKLPAVLQPLLHSGIMLATLSAVVLNVFFNGYQHHADLVKESVSDKDLKVRTVRMWLLMRKLKKNEHGE